MLVMTTYSQPGLSVMGAFRWVLSGFHTTGGKSGIRSLVLLLQLPPLFFTWLMLLHGLFLYVKKIFDIEGTLSSIIVYSVLPVLIFVFIPNSVLGRTVFWKCANVLYLWGSSALFIAVYPFVEFIHGKNITLLDYILFQC